MSSLLLLYISMLICPTLTVDARIFDRIRDRVEDRIQEVRDNPKFVDGNLKLNEVESDEYIITLDDSTVDVESAMRNLAEASGGELKHVYRNVFKGGAISSVPSDRLRAFLDLDIVKSASPNAKASSNALWIQNDASWGLDRLDQSGSSPDGRYQYSYDGTGVEIYIVDSGIFLSHQEFGGRATCGFTAYNDSCEDNVGHGTHVAGIAAGATVGVAKNAQIIGVKVLNNSGIGSSASIIAGIDFVIQQRKNSGPMQPMVINMSLGGVRNNAQNNAVKAAVDAGIVVVVAAGNSRLNACNFSPASSRSAITVGSIDRGDFRSGFSNVGACVDIFAPGGAIISSFPDKNTIFRTASLSGTSMASPFVAGVVSLYLQKDPGMTPSQVWSAIKTDGVRGKIRSFFTRRSPNLIISTQNLF